jgi:glycosyltransferase involved in cell wall biosynthesis
LTYVYQKNQGIGAAVNKGLSIASGEYIQRLDDDDRLEKEKIEKCVEVLQEKPNVGLVATGYKIIYEEENRTRTQMPRSYPQNARFLFMLMACISVQGAVMVRKSCHDVVGLYRTDILAEDYEMWLRIARIYEVATIEEPLAIYRRHRGNITSLNLARLERDTVQFVSSYLNETPLEELIPNIKSKAHGYALKAAVYLLKDGIYVKTVHLAQQELQKALKLAGNSPREIVGETLVDVDTIISRGESLLNLWELVLAVHGDTSPPVPLSTWWRGGRGQGVGGCGGEEKELAKAFLEIIEELKMFKASSLPPESPEMTNFRGRFGKLRGELIRKTYRKAIEG